MRKTIRGILMGLGILLSLIACDDGLLNNVLPTTENQVVRVVDGDTYLIRIDGKEERVRLIGLDTPESVAPQEGRNTKEGVLVSDYMKDYLEGKTVTLEYDVQKRDQYGRILAYVYYEDEMVNEKLLKEGYARVTTYPPNVRYVDQFLRLESQARKAGLGFWGGDSIEDNLPAVVDEALEPEKSPQEEAGLIKGNISRSGDKIYHMPGQRDYDKVRINEANGEMWFQTEKQAQEAGFRRADQ